MLITSTANEQIKNIRKLRDRKYRAETGLFFLEGTRIVIEALEQEDWITQLIVCNDLLNNEKAVETVEKAEINGVRILEVSAEVFRSLSSKDGPQGLAAVARQKWTDLSETSTLDSGIWTALYQIADPGNLGTILRTLDGMGGRGVILLDNCTDPYDPTAMRASMGALFSKQLVKMDSSTFMAWVSQKQIPLIGTSDAASQGYRQTRYSRDMILLMGSEREGIPADLEKCCNSMVSIPMVGNADSLNLAVASSIVLYEIAWQLDPSRKGE
jgi:RNA methyltransferase, TrmH family